MNKWFAKIRKQENGSIAIFVAGLISIMMILFILVLNLGSVYAVKEKSATTAQQASLAATSAFYERVQEIVFSFDPFSYLPEEVEDTTILEPFFSLNFKIQERANSFRTPMQDGRIMNFGWKPSMTMSLMIYFRFPLLVQH